MKLSIQPPVPWKTTDLIEVSANMDDPIVYRTARSSDTLSPRYAPSSASTQYWTPQTSCGSPWILTPITRPQLSAPPPYSTPPIDLPPAPKSASARYIDPFDSRSVSKPVAPAVIPMPGTMASRGYTPKARSPREHASSDQTHERQFEGTCIGAGEQMPELAVEPTGFRQRLARFLKRIFHPEPIDTEGLDFIEETHWTDGT